MQLLDNKKAPNQQSTTDIKKLYTLYIVYIYLYINININVSSVISAGRNVTIKATHQENLRKVR